MATYKVIQDIEAEDKFVGPLTLRQFIFAMGGGLFGYLSFFAVTRGFLWALAITLPPTLFGFFMAIPWSKDQPTDVWVLAKLRFRIKPKKRLWDQDGLQELVTITAPKKEEKQLTNNLSESEVKSRLSALAETIDSRGWVIKHDEYQNHLNNPEPGSSDRLINVGSLPQEVPENYQAVPDILEGKPKLDSMLQKSGQERKERIYEKMDQIRQSESVQTAKVTEPIVVPPQGNAYDNEQVLSSKLKASRDSGNIGTSNMHALVIGTTQETTGEKGKLTTDALTGVNKPQASMTEQMSPDILELSQNNDLKVSTIARRTDAEEEKEPKEVVISLH